jgi:phosphoribosylaminoimidazole carboxylase / phosphoribosylaminoimidazole-succinocarboxamide synthase
MKPHQNKNRMKLQKIAEGKTKEIYDISGTDLVLIKNHNSITADNDPAKTKEFDTKATHATTTTCGAFMGLQMSNIRTAFAGRVDSTSFLALKCDMMALEVIGRRYATGSYLKRHPEFKRDGRELHRFDDVLFEVFLKTTGGKLVIDGETLVDGLTPETDDPLIINPFSTTWQLYHPKKERSSLDKTISSEKILGEFTMEDVRELLQDTFRTLELLFAKFDLKLIDIKIELGVDEYGNLVVSDVIDNDSWRLMDKDWVEMSKQRFRDGDDLANVEAYYEKVANIASQFPLFTPKLLGQSGDPTEWDWSELIE